MCKSTVIFTILCSICFARAQSVALSGVVKLSNGTPVEGVTVSLAGLSSLSILTKKDGTFSLKNAINRVTSVPSTPLNWHFTLQENSIQFTPTDLKASLYVRVYTNDGRITTSSNIPARSAGNNLVTLPLLGSGIYFITVKTGEMEIIRPLLQVGKKLYCENGTVALAGSGTIPAANKKAAGSVVDTLIAKKDGYSTAKHPLTSYEQDEIEVILEPEDDYSGSITNLSVRANPNSVLSAYVSWTTEKAATSKVQFGVGGVQWEIAHKEATTEHEVLVIGMRAKTKYQIRAISGKAQADTSYTTGTLPAHIPEGSVKSSAGSVDGWTLVNVLRGTGGIIPRSNYPAAAVMYDHDGRVVWYRVHGTIADLGGCTSTEFIEKDNTVIVGATDKEPPREYDLAGNILWEGPSPIVPNTYAITHHASKMSNGHYLLVGWGEKEQVGAPAPGSFGVDSLTWANLREVTLDNKVVWEWHLKDFITVPASAKDDYFHANSATVFPERDEVYFDCRWIGLIKTTYKNPTLIYRIPASYNSASPTDMSFNPPQSQFSDVHDPEIHLDDSTVMFFDNGGYDANMMFNPNGKYNFHSRVVEYKIDETGKKASLKWEFPGTINNNSFFKDTFYMPYWGDADRLDNDNVLFTASVMGSGKVSHIVEVTRAGEVVWDFTLPADNGMYRAQRIPTPPLVRPIGE
jgi:hypothetical protein